MGRAVDLVIEPGQMRHRVVLQSAAEAADSYGQPTQTWSNVATRWAKIEPLRSLDRWRAQQSQPEQTHVVTIRAGGILNTVTAKHRLLVTTMSNTVLHILGVPTDVGGRGTLIELQCVERE